MTPTLQILQGDCRDTLRTLPEESVNCVVTSPPYWGLRDYGCAGQIGLEQSLDEFLAQLVGVFREVRRVLRNDGTCWVNMGDTYVHGMPGGGCVFENGRTDGRRGHESDKKKGRTKVCTLVEGLKTKELIGQPWRLAFALQADGWWLRQDIIWHKPNPMPESVRDRCTKAHEYLFLMTKAASYFWDSEAMKEPTAGTANPRASKSAIAAIEARRAAGVGVTESNRGLSGVNPKHSGEQFQCAAASTLKKALVAPVESRNRRSVWTVQTEPYSEAHFATYPPSLVRPCILAGCPVGGTVLDPFGGSGTTGQVALELGRNAILCELNPEYVELIQRRCAVTPGLALS